MHCGLCLPAGPHAQKGLIFGLMLFSHCLVILNNLIFVFVFYKWSLIGTLEPESDQELWRICVFTVPYCSIYRVFAMLSEHGSPVDIAHMNGQQGLKQVLDIRFRYEWVGRGVTTLTGYVFLWGYEKSR